ncbi:MAG: hypothetical protein AB1894_26675 [Chloroflexota bacterium]
MKPEFSPGELAQAAAICADLLAGRSDQGIQALRALQDEIYAAIPDKQRISRGITWVLQRVSLLLAQTCQDDGEILALGQILAGALSHSDRLYGAPVFLMAEYGKRHPAEVFDFFEQTAQSDDWVVREFAAAGFHKLIGPNREVALPFLQRAARAPQPNLRRFASETLRPVTDNRWLLKQPEYSLSVLRLLFREAHPYPRTSVGNNLSDLSRRQSELIYAIVAELVASGDSNSYWIAHRACRNLVKQDPLRVMDALGVDEYHYKDRNFYRSP